MVDRHRRAEVDDRGPADTQQLDGRVRVLTERYGHTLPEMAKGVSRRSKPKYRSASPRWGLMRELMETQKWPIPEIGSATDWILTTSSSHVSLTPCPRTERYTAW